jgi:hypothetical protein
MEAIMYSRFTVTIEPELLATLDARVIRERAAKPGHNITRADIVRAAIVEAEEKLKSLEVKPVAKLER